MRYPTASATEVAFVAEDQLWIAPLHGGLAHRVVEDTCVVTTPLFSPDGRWIAYTCRHGGLRDVFVVAAGGGQPKRLTFEATRAPDGAAVVAWTPDSERVVFLSRRDAPVHTLIRAFSVSVAGGNVEQLPLDRAGMLSFAPGGREIAYNRIFRNLELRKRYLGGQQQDIYTYNFDSRVLKRLTDWKGTDTSPMWFGRSIYFVSDRGDHFRQNIWRLDVSTGVSHQVTHFTDYDVDWPSLSAATITFQQGGHLWAVDLPSETLREIQVKLPGGELHSAAKSAHVGEVARATDAMGHIDYAVSPDGDAVLLSARGDVFRLNKASEAQDLTNTVGADEDHPSWSPDGTMVAYTTDRSGEQQVAVRPVSGDVEKTLTQFAVGYFYAPVWSPKGDSLVVPDASHALWWVHLDGRSAQKIAFDPHAEIRDAAFSPDGQWIAYSTQRSTQLRAIHLHELATGRDEVISSPMESDRFPVFTQDGRYLIFASQRNEQPFVSDRDDESLITTVNSDGLYAVPLQRNGDPLKAGVEGVSATRPSGQIDLDGMMSRAVALPVTPTNIALLQVGAEAVYYQAQPIQTIGGDLAGSVSTLHALNLSTLEDRVVTTGLDDFSLSADGQHVAYRHDSAWYLADTAADAQQRTIKLRLDALTAQVDPAREWQEMFENAWRLDRDVFFSKVINGSDWQKVHDAYARLVPCVASQDDFVYLLGQMQGEMASSHTFIDPRPQDEAAPSEHTGLLGADYELDSASGRYRFKKIYTGDATRPAMRGPLGVPSTLR